MMTDQKERFKGSVVVHLLVVMVVVLFGIVLLTHDTHAAASRTVTQSVNYTHGAGMINPQSFPILGYGRMYYPVVTDSPLTINHVVSTNTNMTNLCPDDVFTFSYDPVLTYNASGGAWDSPYGTWCNNTKTGCSIDMRSPSRDTYQRISDIVGEKGWIHWTGKKPSVSIISSDPSVISCSGMTCTVKKEGSAKLSAVIGSTEVRIWSLIQTNRKFLQYNDNSSIFGVKRYSDGHHHNSPSDDYRLSEVLYESVVYDSDKYVKKNESNTHYYVTQENYMYVFLKEYFTKSSFTNTLTLPAPSRPTWDVTTGSCLPDCILPKTTLSVSPSLITDGQSVKAQWSSGGADSCTGDTIFTTKTSPYTWTPTFTPGTKKTYTYTCTNVANSPCSTTKTATVTKCKTGQVIDGGICKNVGKCGTANTKAYLDESFPLAKGCASGSTPIAYSHNNMPNYYNWSCHAPWPSTITKCSADLTGKCGPAAQGEDSYTTNEPTDLCTSGKPTPVTGGNGAPWEWKCQGTGSNNNTEQCSALSECPTDKLQCDNGNQCLHIDAVDGTAMLTKDGVSGDKEMRVNMLDGDDNPTVCSSNNNIECTFDVIADGFTDGGFTILRGQSSGTYDINGGELSDYVKAGNDAMSLEINPVECKTLTNGGVSDDKAKLVFTCLEAKCVGDEENATCEKTPRTDVSSIDDCVRECTSIGECTSSTGTIKEVQP